MLKQHWTRISNSKLFKYCTRLPWCIVHNYSTARKLKQRLNPNKEPRFIRILCTRLTWCNIPALIVVKAGTSKRQSKSGTTFPLFRRMIKAVNEKWTSLKGHRLDTLLNYGQNLLQATTCPKRKHKSLLSTTFPFFQPVISLNNSLIPLV